MRDQSAERPTRSPKTREGPKDGHPGSEILKAAELGDSRDRRTNLNRAPPLVVLGDASITRTITSVK